MGLSHAHEALGPTAQPNEQPSPVEGEDRNGAMPTEPEVVTKAKAGDLPPRRSRTIYDWKKIVRQMKRKPGQWFCVFENGPTSTTTAVKAGSIAALRPLDEFEVETRNNKRTSPRTCDLWLRYVGADKEHA